MDGTLWVFWGHGHGHGHGHEGSPSWVRILNTQKSVSFTLQL